MIFTDTTGGVAFAKDPCVIKFNGEYFMYYTTVDKKDEELFYYIGIAKSKNLDNWSIVGHLRPSMSCEENGFCAPGGVVIDNKIHLFYQTYGNWDKDKICHAVSTDGINFERNTKNPVFSPKKSEWTCSRAIDADVCVIGDKLFLYYATRDPKMKIQKIGVASAPINSDFSPSAWIEECSDSILEPVKKWEGECIEAPAVVNVDGEIYMFYGGDYNCHPQQIGCAKSTDGVHFKRVFEEPFLTNGNDGEWNSSESGHPFIFKDTDGSLVLFYQGSCDGGRTWYLSNQRIIIKDGIVKLDI